MKREKRNGLAIEGMVDAIGAASAARLKLTQFVNGHNYNPDNQVTIQDRGFWSQPLVAGQSTTALCTGPGLSTWTRRSNNSRVNSWNSRWRFPGWVGEFPTGANPALALRRASLTARMEKK